MADILLVEDDSSLRSAYKMILTAHGYHVESAANGQEALKILKDFSPRIILLDLLMPVMGGLEFLKKYKRHKDQDVDILLLTNMPSSPEVKQCLKLGVTLTAVKATLTPAALLELIKEVIKAD
jgi:CheY-like chemotaxis protein